MPDLQFVADIMPRRDRRALTNALEHFLRSERRDEIWPDSRHVPLGDVDLVVLPLERVGAPAGQSGGRVFVAYFRARTRGTGAPERPFSRALAVKIDKRQKMRDERSRVEQLPPLAATTETRLATPIDCLDLTPIDDDRAVLIAPFRSIYEPPEDIRVNDLWSVLQTADGLREAAHDDAWPRVFRHVEGALDAVDGLHRGEGSGRRTQSYAKAMEWYLRKTRVSGGSPGRQAHFPNGIFGYAPRVNAFGRDWVNPTGVIDELLQPKRTFRTTMGSVHGDLHPRNIVLDKWDEPHIIDFGWARTDAPVVLDYILLDINLRSITLPSQVDESAVFGIAGFLHGDRKPTGLRPAVRARVDLIHEHIWGRVKRRGIVEDWTAEYVIPFFMMAYGLLVHLDTARNQMALVATVLAAAEYIDGADGK